MKQSKRKRDSDAPADSAVAPPASSESAGASTDAARHFALQSNCTVRDSVGLREQLLRLIDEPLPVTLDVRAVERVDTAAMQVLCAFVRDRRTAGRAVSWLGAPESFVEAVSLLGMAQSLGLQSGASAA